MSSRNEILLRIYFSRLRVSLLNDNFCSPNSHNSSQPVIPCTHAAGSKLRCQTQTKYKKNICEPLRVISFKHSSEIHAAGSKLRCQTPTKHKKNICEPLRVISVKHSSEIHTAGSKLRCQTPTKHKKNICEPPRKISVNHSAILPDDGSHTIRNMLE